ncbi:carbohydrate porin [Stenomitos frigidus]|uniref:Porin n=1 Tax=Stenomitos frigidus ULC18 TaxID=2107698 RepID=A0A2T1ECK0_9CYAN|nr:carbohydrate porin [Stenomitos frigidus]PSB30413.1 hypothetical protein C7B82_08910 [Stenomitos frigidus ULC18]
MLLKLIWLNPLLCFGFTVALMLTAGVAEVLINCPSALADSKPDDLPESITDAATAAPVPSAQTQVVEDSRSSTFKKSGVLQEYPTRSRQAAKAMTQALVDATSKQSVALLPEFNPANLQLASTAVDSLVQPSSSQACAESAADQCQWLNQQRRPNQQLTFERSSLLLADSGVPAPSDKVRRQGSEVLGVPSIQLQGVFKQEGSDTSARARLTTFYPVTPNAAFGAEVDLTTGRGFADSQETGLNLNELYFAGSLPSLPTLRFVVGLMDLTSYFDRNSFAKDGATHFFNSVFQTNPALAAAGIASRPGLLVNWSVTDDIDLKATTFSSSRSLGDFHLDGFAGEVGVRFGTAIIRGTYVSSRDAGQRSGFREIFDIPRSGRSGPRSGDREEAYGINGEFFIPSLKLGLFGRYGHYTNLNLDSSGTTYSAGLNFLDIFLPNDRLGIGYGRQLSNDDLRRARGDQNPDVLELFYDFRITPNLRAAVMLQERNAFSETVLGVRVRTDFDLSPLFRRSR